MIVLALIFPRLYKTFWAEGLAVDRQTFYLNITVAIASITVAVLAPFLGSLAELGGIRKKLLLRFAVCGMLASIAIFFIGQGLYPVASLFFIIGTVSFYCANIFFDSMLSSVSKEDNRHFVSGLGFAFAYCSGLSLVLISNYVISNAEGLGFADTISASRWLFVLAGVWWAVFTIPLFFVIQETPKPVQESLRERVVMSFSKMKATFLEIIKIKHIFWFLLAYLFYIDGVNTVITTASFYGTTIGFSQEDIIRAFLCVQVAGIPCALLFGVFAEKWGARAMIFTAIIIYIGICIFGAFISREPVHLLGYNVPQMYILALLVGLVQGGVQALSRSYFTSIIPKEKSVAYFGFYSMIGKSAAILGPLLMAGVAIIFNDPDNPVFSTRLGFASLTLLFIAGGFCFLMSKPQTGEGQ